MPAVIYLFLAGAYVQASLFLFALYQAFKLLSYIDSDKAFSEPSVRALRHIKHSAVTIGLLMVAGVACVLVLSVGTGDDIAGPVAVGLMGTFASSVVAVATAVLQQLVQKCIDAKKGGTFMQIKILLPICLTSVLLTTGYAQTLDKAKFDHFFDRLAERNPAMGSLIIAKEGNGLYSRVIGYSQINRTEKKPLTAASRFGIASITKIFTAVMILQLVEEGKLKLTDTLDKFYPQVPNASKIIIVQILAHRSGIPISTSSLSGDLDEMATLRWRRMKCSP